MAACGGGGNSAPAVVSLELEITPTDGGNAIKLDGATILPEEQNGSDAENGNPPVSLGKITSNKNDTSDTTYRMAEDATDTKNAVFAIVGGELFYIGPAVDFETASAADKIFTISIDRFNNPEDAANGRNGQIVTSVINLQDIEEVLIVTPAPAADVPYFSIENGQIFLHENVAGNGADGTSAAPKFLATLTDGGIESSYTITYRVANNEHFTILNGNELYYVGPELDFEIATQKQFALNIERIRDGDTDNPQTFTHTVNLKNLNDTAPTPLVGYEGESTDAIDEFRVAGDVGDGDFFMVLNVDAKDDKLTINFTLGDTTPGTGDAYRPLAATPQYATPGDDTTKVTGFTIKTGTTSVQNIVLALNDKENTNLLRDSNADFTAWDKYINFVTYSGSKTGAPPATDVLFTSDPVILDGRGRIEVNEGTDGIIANFASTDADNLQPLRYSLDGADADAFAIDENGNLRFVATPNYASPTDANGSNFYKVTVKVSDGLAAHDKTYPLLVAVQKAESPSSTASEAAPTAAEAVPSKEPQKWEPSPFDNIFDDDPFGPIGGGGGDGVL